MKNIILTDCSKTKFIAQKGVLDSNFGMHNYERMLFSKKTYEEDSSDPKNYLELCENIESRINKIQQNFLHLTTTGKIDESFYLLTLKKGFLQNPKSKTWTFVSAAGFCKLNSPVIIGLSGGVALKSEFSNLMDLSQEERCMAFRKEFPFMEKTSLIECINGTKEVDWFKEAYRNCIPFGR